jgi:hypothetical protein
LEWGRERQLRAVVTLSLETLVEADVSDRDCEPGHQSSCKFISLNPTLLLMPEHTNCRQVDKPNNGISISIHVSLSVSCVSYHPKTRPEPKNSQYPRRSRDDELHTTADTHESQLRDGQRDSENEGSALTKLNDAQNKMDTHGKPCLLVFLKRAGAFPAKARPSVVAIKSVMQGI